MKLNLTLLFLLLITNYKQKTCYIYSKLKINNKLKPHKTIYQKTKKVD